MAAALSDLLKDPQGALDALRTWATTTPGGRAAAVSLGAWLLSKVSDRLRTPWDAIGLLAGLPAILVYVPVRVAVNRLVYPRVPNVPGANAVTEAVTRTTQFLFGVLPSGSAGLVPDAVFEALTFQALHPGCARLWHPVDGPKDGLPEGVKGAWIEDPELKKGEEDVVFLYAHGGGYCIFHPAQFSNFCICLYKSLVAKGKKPRIFAIDYDLAPGARFPRQLEQMTAAYSHLVKTLGIPPEKITVGGDSAGANLALSLCLHLHAGAPGLPKPDLPKPGALVLVSPWTRLWGAGETIPEGHTLRTRDGGDYINRDKLVDWTMTYAGSRPTTDPWLSLALQPPAVLAASVPARVLVTAGGAEIILTDIKGLCANLPGAQVAVEEGRIHDYATLDVTFGLGMGKEERERGVETISGFMSK